MNLPSISPTSKVWLKSAGAAFIGGGSTALTTWGGLRLAQSMGADVPSLNLKSAGIIFAIAGLHGLALYLAKSPLPGVTTGASAS